MTTASDQSFALSSLFRHQSELALSPQERWLASLLLSFPPEKTPTLRRIAEWSGVARSTIQSHVGGLKEKGCLRVNYQYGADGTQLASSYDFTPLFERIAELESRDTRRFIQTGVRRRHLSPNLVLAVFRKDNFTCQHCGGHDDLTIDHIVPVVVGGTGDKGNLQTLCRSCNSAKGAR